MVIDLRKKPQKKQLPVRQDMFKNEDKDSAFDSNKYLRKYIMR
jgi:hypothetical protein